MQAIQLNLNNLRSNFKTLAKLHHETQSNLPSQTKGAQSNPKSSAQSNPQSDSQSNLASTFRRLSSIEEVNENDALWSTVSPLSNNEVPVNATAPEDPQSNEAPVNATAPEDPQSNEAPVNLISDNSNVPDVPEQVNEMAIPSNDTPLDPLDTAASQIPQSNDVSASQIPQSNDPSQAYAAEEAISQSAVDSLDVMCDYMIMTINKGKSPNY